MMHGGNPKFINNLVQDHRIGTSRKIVGFS